MNLHLFTEKLHCKKSYSECFLCIHNANLCVVCHNGTCRPISRSWLPPEQAAWLTIDSWLFIWTETYYNNNIGDFVFPGLIRQIDENKICGSATSANDNWSIRVECKYTSIKQFCLAFEKNCGKSSKMLMTNCVTKSAYIMIFWQNYIFVKVAKLAVWMYGWMKLLVRISWRSALQPAKSLYIFQLLIATKFFFPP